LSSVRTTDVLQLSPGDGRAAKDGAEATATRADERQPEGFAKLTHLVDGEPRIVGDPPADRSGGGARSGRNGGHHPRALPDLDPQSSDCIAQLRRGDSTAARSLEPLARSAIMFGRPGSGSPMRRSRSGDDRGGASGVS
jgi:hypothetical protein